MEEGKDGDLSKHAGMLVWFALLQGGALLSTLHFCSELDTLCSPGESRKVSILSKHFKLRGRGKGSTALHSS